MSELEFDPGHPFFGECGCVDEEEHRKEVIAAIPGDMKMNNPYPQRDPIAEVQAWIERQRTCEASGDPQFDLGYRCAVERVAGLLGMEEVDPRAASSPPAQEKGTSK